ncbi:MAG TPA: FadR/GntR family transcriptional regulator [Burkholderiaceae bacterium]|nr:FadR/GntR family transcriptional regulator [Burkholderiaceae bacterium]
MPIQAIETRRLYRQIADHIADLVRSGEYPPGSRLPPERDLAVQLRVSRPSVREALIALEVEGFVEVRVGSGVYVTKAPPSSAPPRLDADSGPFELISARRLIEGECAALAAHAGTAAQLRAIKGAFEKMVSACDPRTNRVSLADDRRFHERIAEAANNSALAMVVHSLWEQRMGPLYMKLEDHFTRPSTWATINAEHRAILTAITSRDARQARAAMQRHLDNAARRFSESWNARPAPARASKSKSKAGKNNGRVAPKPRPGSRSKSGSA